MAEPKIPLLPEKFYHIYNRGTNSNNIFREYENYEYFLRLYERHISPIAETYAWVLMKNHFHLLVKILPPPHPDPPDPEGFKNLQGRTGRTLTYEKRVNQQFSNFFNAYAKSFNKRYKRTGSFFEHTFKRKPVEDFNYLKTLVVYIHQNPVHHGFCSHPIEYPWSSYSSYLTFNNEKMPSEIVIGWFGDDASFKTFHEGLIDFDEIEKWLEI